MYNNIVSILKEGAEHMHYDSVKKCYKDKYVIGMNQHVREAHCDARLSYHSWLLYNKPTHGFIYENMSKTRNNFKT